MLDFSSNVRSMNSKAFLLALSEHLGFTAAYWLATAISTALVSGYARAILKGAARIWVIAPLMIGMHAFLYTLLREEDAALLFGSLGLALILGLLMFFTRHIDWFKLGEESSPEQRETLPS